MFALSSGLVMCRHGSITQHVSRAYNKWIRAAAAVDSRLTEARVAAVKVS